MKTGSLIETLAADVTPASPQVRRLGWALAGGVLAGGLGFWLFIHPRPDFLRAIETARFDFKFGVTLMLIVSAYAALRQAMRPEWGARPLSMLLWLAPAMLAIAVAMELISVPESQWAARWIGHNWAYCMTLIPLLSLMPLALLITVLAQGASTAPGRSGALAGLVAGGVGAFFYAAHCPDDSPLFVATWYPIGIAVVALIGAATGRRLLRW